MFDKKLMRHGRLVMSYDTYIHGFHEFDCLYRGELHYAVEENGFVYPELYVGKSLHPSI